jgi:hypothetical protein
VLYKDTTVSKKRYGVLRHSISLFLFFTAFMYTASTQQVFGADAAYVDSLIKKAGISCCITKRRSPALRASLTTRAFFSPLMENIIRRPSLRQRCARFLIRLMTLPIRRYAGLLHAIRGSGSN